MSFIRALPAFCFLFLLVAAAQSETSYAGHSLEEALRGLQQKGLNILFSSDLVRPDMVVQSEPVSPTPIQKLEELLSPYGLEWISGPRNTLLVVQRERNATASDRTGPDKAYLELSSYVVIPFVTVYLSAQDQDNHFITQLGPEHFMIKEDGHEQKIVDFMNLSEAQKPDAAAPVNFFFLMDVSQSMTLVPDRVPNFQIFQQTALAVNEQLQTGDRSKLLAFNQELRTIQEMTSDRNAIRAQLKGIQDTKGHTAVVDALLQVVDDARNYEGRKVVILFSDGCDNVSKASLDDALSALKASDVTVFAFGSSLRDALTQKGTDLLNKITEVTGGYASFPKNVSEIAASAGEMHREIKSQYAAGYIPPDPDLRKWRQVEIKCKVPGVRLRYRKSYLF